MPTSRCDEAKIPVCGPAADLHSLGIQRPKWNGAALVLALTRPIPVVTPNAAPQPDLPAPGTVSLHGSILPRDMIGTRGKGETSTGSNHLGFRGVQETARN